MLDLVVNIVICVFSAVLFTLGVGKLYEIKKQEEGIKSKIYNIKVPRDIDIKRGLDFAIQKEFYDNKKNPDQIAAIFGNDALNYILETNMGDIYRGIKADNLETVLCNGTDRTEKDGNDYQNIKAKTGLDANEYIYGDRNEKKAIEFIESGKEILLVYDGSQLEKLKQFDYAYKLKDPETSWKDALKMILIIKREN